MATVKTHTWRLSQAYRVTNWTKITACLPIDWCLANVNNLFACLFDAFWLQTRETNLFTRKPTTQMTACVNFSTAFRYEGLALLFHADFSKSGVRIIRAHFDLFLAESAFSCVLIILSVLASHANMVRISSTRGTKDFLTVLAANSEFSHMLGWLPRYYFIAFISLGVVYRSRLQVYCSIAVASNHVWVQIDSHVHLFLLDLI